MKITVMSHIYSMVMVGTFKKQLQKHMCSDDIKKIIHLTNKEYKEILKRAPEIGGKKNMFISNYHMGAYLIALYKNTKDKISVEEFRKIIVDGLNDFSFIKRKMKNKDLLSKKFKDKVIKAGIWCEQNKDVYPTNWLVSVKDEKNSDLTNLVFTRCGLCNLCKNEGVPEFLSLLCETDYITMSFAGCKLKRPTTIGNGDDSCDFYITRK